VLKSTYQNRHYLEWPADLVHRRPEALARAHKDHAEQTQRVRFAQFLLARQAEALRRHAAGRGVRLIGDLPFFVSPDSSDIWANPELFLLDDARRLRAVAGVPPDAFTADGQLWGNPLYDWTALAAMGFRWWIQRVRALLTHVDVVRLDHFRAFAAAWHVPADAPTARSGQWVSGPGAALLEATARELGGLPFIAEDLGVITPDVERLRDDLGLPGTRVLQFAFDGDARNPHLPENYPTNAVVYTGTHDNETTRGWYEGLSGAERRRVQNVLGRPAAGSADAVWALVALAWTSPAALAIAPFQDILGLGNEARMNVPGRADGNWRWRCTIDTLEPRVFEPLRNLTIRTHRSAAGRAP
jgi:4-alpha-glucanotransferase